MRQVHLKHRFVEFIPESLDEGVLYVSMEYMTVAHLCCCGCGSEVSITLSPTDWQLTYDGKSISLSPSIGSWNLPCRSHYWIKRNRVSWAEHWRPDRVQAGRDHDANVKRGYFGDETVPPVVALARPEAASPVKPTLWVRLTSFFHRK